MYISYTENVSLLDLDIFKILTEIKIICSYYFRKYMMFCFVQ